MIKLNGNKRILGLLSKKPLSVLPRTYAKHLMNYCRKCGRERIDTVFDYYENRSIGVCRDCWVHAKIFTILVESLFNDLGLEKGHHNQFFTGKYRKVSRSIIRGIVNFGFRK